jgi:integral membrane protein (TIGR01906 family)
LRIFDTITKWVFAVSLAFVLLTGSIAWVTNSAWFYNWGFRQNNVTFLAPSELDKAANGLITYFNSSDQYINLTVIRDGQPFTLFSQKEIDHLKDVKALFHMDYNILRVSFLVCMAFVADNLVRRNRRNLLQGIVFGSGLTLALMILMGIGSLFDFSALFWQFHIISFSNQDWLLSETDSLIMLFPEPFWQAAALLIALAAAVAALVLGIWSFWRLRKTRE